MFMRRSLGSIRVLRDGTSLPIARLRANINKVTLVGTVMNAPKITPFPQTGQHKVSFSLATNDFYKSKDGTSRNYSEYHNIAIYQENIGDYVAKNILKGAQVYVEGSISSYKYKGNDGTDKKITEIKVSFNGCVKVLVNGPVGEEIEYIDDQAQDEQQM